MFACLFLKFGLLQAKFISRPRMVLEGEIHIYVSNRSRLLYFSCTAHSNSCIKQLQLINDISLLFGHTFQMAQTLNLH